MDAKHMGQEGTWGFNLDTDVDVPTPWEGKIWEGDLTGNAEESRKLVDDFDVEGLANLRFSFFELSFLF